jgi:hypothetical protein
MILGYTLHIHFSQNTDLQTPISERQANAAHITRIPLVIYSEPNIHKAIIGPKSVQNHTMDTVRDLLVTMEANVHFSLDRALPRDRVGYRH